MNRQVDLTTEYLGFSLPHPVVPSASPLTGDIDTLHLLVEAGAPAVVLPSLFEEQVEHDALAIHHGLEFGAGYNAEAPEGYFPELDDYNSGPDDYLELVARAEDELDVPIIASLNGVSPGGWTHYARLMEKVGANAIELNIYFLAADVTETGADVESRCLALVEGVKSAVEVPVAVKIGPYFSSMASMARRFEDAGADALVLFNRFYQPDIELDGLEVSPHLVLSTPNEFRLPLRWIGILRDLVDIDLAATTGVHTATEVIKSILVGANVTMMASALLKRGPVALTEAVDGLHRWLAENDYESVQQACGSMSRDSTAHPDEYERANYMQTLVSYSTDWRRTRHIP
ncbi:MAG TPA: dihydroorotate dehydrogenase-like protein [Acidimicrobiia bacterium]|nr:dihydroorotate dehydrogenase-like protein [Acidimicrobiia bacterium]